MLNSAGLNESFWAEAVACAAYLRNRSPTKALDGKTPFEMFTGHKPVVKHLRVFGCIAIALEKGAKKKFQEKGKEYIMVGYSKSSKEYRLYDKSTGDVKISRDVCFIEKSMSKMNKSDSVTVMLEEIDADRKDNVADSNGVSDNQDDEDIQEEAESDDEQTPTTRRGPGRPTIVRTGLRGRPRKLYNELNMMLASNIDVPVTVQQAQSSPQAVWREANWMQVGVCIEDKFSWRS